MPCRRLTQIDSTATPTALFIAKRSIPEGSEAGMGSRPGGASSRAECCPPPQRCLDCLQLLGGQHICTRKASSLKALSRRSQEAAGSLKFRIHDPFALPEPCSGCKDSAATCGTPRNPLFAWTSSASTSVPLLQDLPLSRAHPCRLAKTWRGRLYVIR